MIRLTLILIALKTVMSPYEYSRKENTISYWREFQGIFIYSRKNDVHPTSSKPWAISFHEIQKSNSFKNEKLIFPKVKFKAPINKIYHYDPKGRPDHRDMLAWKILEQFSLLDLLELQ